MFFRTTQRKTSAEIELMREACRLTAETLCHVDAFIAPGVTTEDIDRVVHEHTLSQGALPAPLGYRGFPKSCCTSINEVVCHGIPDARVLEDGDIINIDVSHVYQGFHGDTSAMFYVGTPSREAVHITEVARRCLELGIAEVGPDARFGDIGAAIEEFAQSQECTVVRDYAGHGIGRKFHEPPTVRHFGRRGTGERMLPGMTFTIEPMINLGTHAVEKLSDGWTVVTCDQRLSAQFEHTLLVTEHGCEVLTVRAHGLRNSDRFPDYLADQRRSSGQRS